LTAPARRSPLSRDLASQSQTHLPDCLERLSRLALAQLPTPLQEMRRLTAFLGGPRLFIKRDDLTGLATGGNKARKLEFLIADALDKEADCVITAGGPQSNHCRLTAAAAARVGLKCHLVLGGDPPSRAEGNLLLDEILGAQIHWVSKYAREQRMEELAVELRSAGAKPYIIPIGGSTPIGALGYVAAMYELSEQLVAANLSLGHIFFATSSGGTHAGLTLGAGLTGFSGKLTGISIDQVPDETSPYKYREFVANLANDAAGHLRSSYRFSADDIFINYDYLGGGYGVVGDLERKAVTLLAQSEGILVGPVYTARALGGLIDLIHQGAFRPNENVLFWHTGDETALHAYAGEFAELQIVSDPGPKGVT
jgi:D-cysteine desulfhydrase family pyridoxal phosphate-dependent enzyme